MKTYRGTKGVDWSFGPNYAVLWSADAREKLRHDLQPTHVKNQPSFEKAAAVATDPTETLTVSPKRVPNPRMVLATRACGELVKVMLGGQAELFWHPMKLLATPGENQLWHWTGNPANPKAGRRLPRKKGVW